MAGVRSLRKSFQLGTLGHKADGSTTLGDVALDLVVLVDGEVCLLNDDEVLALVVFQALVTRHESLGQQICVGVLGLVQLNTGGAGLEVESSTEEVLILLVGHKSDAIGSQRSATVADDSSLAVLALLLGAVLVEDTAVLLDNSDEGEAGSGVDAGELGVVDGGVKVLGVVCDVDDELEAL